MRTLITGAGGFIGRHLVEAQLNMGRAVRALDLHTASLDGMKGRHHLEIIQGDVQDTALLEEIADGVDVVFHLASIHLSVAAPDAEYRRVNVEATKNFLQVCHSKQVARFVHCSSVGVHGRIHTPPAHEGSVCFPESIYDITKLEGEREVLAFHQRTGFPVVVVRPAWVYGPGCPRTFRLFKSIQQRRFFFIGDGTTLRHSLYVTDMVEAFELCAHSAQAVGHIYIFADDAPVSIKDLVTKISTLVGVSPPRWHVPLRVMHPVSFGLERAFQLLGKEPPLSRRSLSFFTNNTHFDTSKARNELGFAPRISLDEGLRLSYEWVRTQGGL